MKNYPRFSIIIPVYNIGLYLEECLQSVLKQNFNNYQLILVDDGSTDNSCIICNKYAASDSRLKIIHQKNQGASAARNAGIQHAEGEYIIFLDGDDYWSDTEVLSIINNRLNASNADVLSFNYVKFYSGIFKKPYFAEIDNMPLKMLSQNNSFDYLVENELWIACPWNKAIKRELFIEGNLYFKVGITSEDIDWCLRLAIIAQRFDYISDVIVYYRQRSGSVSNNITTKKVDTLIDNIESCILILDKNTICEKSAQLQPYIGYLFGTAMFSVSCLNDSKERNRLICRLKKNKYALNWSSNKKIKLLQVSNKIGGIKFVVFLLRIRNVLNKIFNRGLKN